MNIEGRGVYYVTNKCTLFAGLCHLNFLWIQYKSKVYIYSLRGCVIIGIFLAKKLLSKS